MDFSVWSDILIEAVRHHWFSALLLLITLVTIGSFALLRWLLRRRWKKLAAQIEDEDFELDLVSPLSAQDHQAIALIKRLRRQVWELPEEDLQLSIEALSQQAIKVVRAVATIYHEQITAPEFEASLLQSLQLVRRVTVKAIRLANLYPFRFLGNQKLSDYQRYYQVYKKINDHPFLQILKRHPSLHRVARWAVNLKNLGNPLYWAGKELSREGYFLVLRWFYLAFIGQVGREAMRLYGGRQCQREEDREAALVCYRLFKLTEKWGGPSPDEWRLLVGFIANQTALEPEIKLHILSRCAKYRYPQELESYVFQTRAAKKTYLQALNDLLKTEPRRSDKTAIIHTELSQQSNASVSRQESDAPSGSG